MSLDTNFIAATYPVADANISIALLGRRGNSRFMGTFFDKKYCDSSKKSKFIVLNQKDIFVTLSNVRKAEQNDYSHLQNKQIALILVDVTDQNALDHVDCDVNDIKHTDIKATFLVATRCDKAKDRLITSAQLEARARDLKLNGFLEINSKDRSLVKQVVNIAISHVTNPPKAPQEPVEKKESPSKDQFVDEFASALSKAITVGAKQEINPLAGQLEEVQKELKFLKAQVLDMQSSPWSNFVNWFSNLFSCFGIFKRSVNPESENEVVVPPKHDITPPDVKDF